MAETASDLHRAKRGVAMLAAVLVQTINESDPTFQERFLERLKRAYFEVRDQGEGDVIQELELFSWTAELLTGLGRAAGHGEPFLGDRGTHPRPAGGGVWAKRTPPERG